MLLTIADLDQPAEILAPYMLMAQGLTQIYLSHIANSQSKPRNYKVSVGGGGSKDRKPGIHASEVSKCERQIVYSLMGTERRPNTTTVDVNMLMRFGLGHAVHAMLQHDWHSIADDSNKRLKFESEIPIHPGLGGKAEEWTIMSSADGVITMFDENLQPAVRIGVEIKTESEGQFDKLRMPRPDHMEQTCIYMATLDLPLMWTIYYNKSSSNFTGSKSPWLFTFNKLLWEDLEIKFVRAHHSADAKLLPLRSEGMYCSWCPFSYTCKPVKLAHMANRNVGVRP